MNDDDDGGRLESGIGPRVGHSRSKTDVDETELKVSKFRKQIMVPKLLPKNKPSSLSWKITTSRLIQKRVYLLAKRT